MKAYGALVTACERGRQWGQALLLLEELRCSRLEADTAGRNAAIRASGKSPHWEQALAFLGQMRSSAFIPDSMSFSGAIRACEMVQH